MAKFFGDLPCANIRGTVHITVSATKLLCGRDWRYRPAWPQNFGRVLKNTNIIYREIDAVTCPECRSLYAATLNGESVVIVEAPEDPVRCGCSGEMAVDNLARVEK